MGFDLRGETAKQNGVFDLGLPWAETKCADADFDEDQANKSARGMPWHQEPTKDVAICDKPRLVESRHTRGFPNGETHL